MEQYRNPMHHPDKIIEVGYKSLPEDLDAIYLKIGKFVKETFRPTWYSRESADFVGNFFKGVQSSGALFAGRIRNMDGENGSGTIRIDLYSRQSINWRIEEALKRKLNKCLKS